MSKLFDHVAKALGEPTNLELLVTTADAMDRRQVVRWSEAATRQMLDTMAELASDPSTVGAVQRNLALVSEADRDGPLRLVPGRFEAVGASLVGVLARGGGRVTEDARYASNPLAAPVAWLLASAIGRHGPRTTDPQALALFLERERRRSFEPVPPRPVIAPPPSHRTGAGAAAPAPPPLRRPASPPQPRVDPGPAVAGQQPAAAAEPAIDDSAKGRSPTTVFVGYMVLVCAVLWVLSLVLSANDLNIVLIDGAVPTTEGGPSPTAVPPGFTPLVTVPSVTLPTPTLPTAPTLPEVELPTPDVLQVTDVTELVDIPFTLEGPPGGSAVTGVAHVMFDQEQNQICHRFELDGIAEPFGRLGIGRSDTQAGVVVDLGLLESGQRSCTRVSSTAMTAFIAAETDHFVEVGDARRVQVVRGQTSARPGLEADGTAVADAADDTGTTGGDDVDPSVVTARLTARPGVLTLVGAVPSEETAELLLAELAVLDGAGIEVIDQSTVDPTAGPPSGAITVDRTNLFAVDRHELSSDGTIVARELAVLFQRNPEWVITVSGHTDSTGDEMNNLELGLRRATEVRDILIAEGVPAERITAEGIGAPKPIADNDTPEGRAQNRRFEIEIRRP